MPRVVVVGGFLGAGKTTLVLHAASMLRSRGMNVGIVTNDQSSELVDTRLATSLGFTVGEVAGGCFCCRFDDLMSAIDTIDVGSSVDVVFAEPVGSCTDIVATVIRPLNRISGNRFVTAPFSVLIDPTRDIREMNELVGYLYRQQLAEADIVVATKIDLIPDGVAEVKARYAGVLPAKAVLGVSSLSGIGVEEWIDCVLATESMQPDLRLDYEKYTLAEAALGWLNLSAAWRVLVPINPMTIAQPLLQDLQEGLRRASLNTAHVKMMLTTSAGCTKGAFTSNRGPVIWDSQGPETPVISGELLLNARAEGSPAELSAVVRESLRVREFSSGLTVEIRHLDCFNPRPPKPSYRLNKRGVSVPLDEPRLDRV